jgi:hypothetical protein
MSLEGLPARRSPIAANSDIWGVRFPPGLGLLLSPWLLAWHILELSVEIEGRWESSRRVLLETPHED